MEENNIENAKKKQSIDQRIEYFFQLLKMNLVPTAIMSVFWLLLGWLKTAGIQWAILWPLNFLSGALVGLEGHVLGGTVGKTILLVIFNSAFRGIIVKRGNGKERWASFQKEFKEEGLNVLLNKIVPQYSNLKMIIGKPEPKRLGYAGLGLCFALFIYPVITGNGSLVNSMVCVAMFISLWKQILRQRGLLIEGVNHLLEKKSMRKINKDYVNLVFAGYAIGMALAVVIAALRQIDVYGEEIWIFSVKILPWILLLLGLVGVLWNKNVQIKSIKAVQIDEEAKEEGKSD